MYLTVLPPSRGLSLDRVDALPYGYAEWLCSEG